MSPERRTRFLLAILAIATSGCLAGEAGTGATLQDATGAYTQDVAVLSDAVLLEPGGPPDFGPREDGQVVGFDVVPSCDASVADAAADASVSQDAWSPEDDSGGTGLPDAYEGAEDEGGSTGDAPTPPADVPLATNCGASEACPAGHACVDDGAGPACMAVDKCGKDGAIQLPDVLGSLMNQGSLYVKLEVRVWAGTPTCSMLECDDDDPCCNTCFAQLFVGKEDFPIVLQGQGQAIGCKGSECDVDDLCDPVVPDKWYWIWGTLELLGSLPQFRVDGFCLVME